MAWTKIIGPEEAQGKLKEVYDHLKARGIDGLAEATSVYTQEPEIFQWLTLGLKPGAGYGVTAIDRRLVELIAVTVSVINECHNCVVVHGRLLRQILKDNALADQIMEDYTGASLDSRTRAALDYASRLTRDPVKVTEEDIHSLREAGYSDKEIVDIAHVAAWFSYVNRIALGLGTQLTRALRGG